MVDQKTDQSKYNDPDDQITDRTGRKILQQIVQQIKEKQYDAEMTGEVCYVGLAQYGKSSCIRWRKNG